MKHLLEEQLILYYYGEAGDDAAVEEHLSSCDSCRTELRELKRILAAVNTLPVPERPANYGSLVWDRLRPRIKSRRRFRLTAFLTPQRLALAGSMAALLLAAFLLGRFWPDRRTETVGVETPGPAAAKDLSERILQASLLDHLERCQMVLTDLSHASGGRVIDIAADQSWAQELIAENRLYRQSALRVGKVGIAGVLDDLERLLLEIANSPSSISSVELTDIQKRIESQGLIFKLRVIGTSMRQKQTEAARELARRAS